MTSLTIKEGLLDESGKVVTGHVVSNAGPLDKIIYTGSTATEAAQCELWAKAARAEFEKKSGSSKKSSTVEVPATPDVTI